MPTGHRRALDDLAACRTAAMGGHVTQCDTCGVEHYVYHSCRNRSGPSCHGVSTRAWLAARETELLPVPYFHVVFTLPVGFRARFLTRWKRVLPAVAVPPAVWKKPWVVYATPTVQGEGPVLRLSPVRAVERLLTLRVVFLKQVPDGDSAEVSVPRLVGAR